MDNIVILSKKEFQDICKSRSNVRITASTNLKEPRQKDDVIEISGKKYRRIEKKSYHRTKGYIDIGDDKYVRVLKFNIFAVILPILILLLFLLFADLMRNDRLPQVGDLIGFEDTDDISDDPATNFVSYVDVPGFKEEISLSEGIPNLALRNPQKNEWNLYYTISESGKQIYETKMITPGKQHDCDLYHILDGGVHTITIATYTATEDGHSTGQPVATQTIRVNIS